MPAHVLECDTRAVAAAPQVPPRHAQRLAYCLEIRDPRRGRVLREVDAASGELGDALARPGQRIDVQHVLGIGPERRAVERRAATGAALVYEDHVAAAPHFDQARRERCERACGLAGSAGEYQQRIGLRRERVGRQHGDEDAESPTVGLGAILGDIHGTAADRGREPWQAALGKLKRARRWRVARAAGERGREHDRERERARLRRLFRLGHDAHRSKRAPGVAWPGRILRPRP
jgi:hypothetical protein